VAEKTVTINPHHFDVAFQDSADSVTVPGSTVVTARTGLYPGSPYTLKIRNDSTGQIVADCDTSVADCSAAVNTDLSDNYNCP
jgi:hypothetical protein